MTSPLAVLEEMRTMTQEAKGFLKHKGVLPTCWIALTVLVLAIDYVTGPLIQFPILYLIPISLASWHSGRWWGLALALGMPLVRVGFVASWPERWTMVEAAINAAIRIVVFVGFAFLLDRVAMQTRTLAHQVRVLRGLLPICGFCKRIRDEGGQWKPFEWYISEHSEARFSHTFCPECGREHYGELVDKEDCPSVVMGGGEDGQQK
jgi:hypothetical protein